MWRHKWHGLRPYDTRLGGSPDEVLTLWRGFAPDQLDPERGMLSSDVLAGNEAAMARIIQAINNTNDGYVAEQISIHAHNGYAQAHGLTTPFVSVSPTEEGAR